VSINRVRAVMVGFLALLAVGSFGASAAEGLAGPFWHHRAVGGKGEGEKVEQAQFEQFQGEGGEQKLKSKAGGTNFTLAAHSVQAKGIVYNTSLQGQIKVLLKYHELKITEPTSLEKCEATIGTNNEVTAEGHLAWKWNGEKKQLEEEPKKDNQKPDIIFTPKPIEENATKLPEGEFTKITFAKATCGVLAGSFPVKGSVSVTTLPANLEEWSTKLVTTFPGWPKQHFWNGKEFVGVEPSLTFGTEPSVLTGTISTVADVQELAVFEK
jgi:hypothetical protein